MNFENFKNSKFYQLGKKRYDYANEKFVDIEFSCLYETLSLNPVDSEVLNPTFKRAMTFFDKSPLFHLRVGLEINHPNWLSQEFRELIGRQWIEVSSITKLLEIQPVNSYLLIQSPGVDIPMHSHSFPYTMTFCYSYTEEGIGTIYDNSMIGISKSKENIYSVKLPTDEKICFDFKGNLTHGVRSNEWRFFYFHDFTEILSIPDCSFTYVECNQKPL